ncbi:MAG: hypothetical protein AAFU71_08995 [Cyanobacteria bacterium J06632_22]
MNPLGNVEKIVVGSVLGLISLLVIYGASASNRVASWVDGTASGRTDLVGLNSDGTSDRAVAQDSRSTSNSSTPVDLNNLTPMEKAGQLPQRQTVVEPSAQADEIRVQPLETAPTAQTTTAGTTPSNTTQPDPAPTVTQPTQETNPAPVRALW